MSFLVEGIAILNNFAVYVLTIKSKLESSFWFVLQTRPSLQKVTMNVK